MNYRLYAVEAGCGTSVGAASTFANATEVRLFNNSSSNQLVTVANAADVTLGTMTLADGCYTFTIYDSYGDGQFDGTNNGSYSLDCSIINAANCGGNWGSSESTDFCVNP